MYANGEYLTPEQTIKEWSKILKNSGKYIDFAAFQDGSAPIEVYESYVKAAKTICDKFDIEFIFFFDISDINMYLVYLPQSF